MTKGLSKRISALGKLLTALQKEAGPAETLHERSARRN